MKDSNHRPLIMLLVCLFLAYQSQAQSNVNVVQSIPITVEKVSAPVSVNILPKTFSYKLLYLDAGRFADQLGMAKLLNDLGQAGFELVSTTQFSGTGTGTSRYLKYAKFNNIIISLFNPRMYKQKSNNRR